MNTWQFGDVVEAFGVAYQVVEDGFAIALSNGLGPEDVIWAIITDGTETLLCAANTPSTGPFTFFNGAIFYIPPEDPKKFKTEIPGVFSIIPDKCSCEWMSVLQQGCKCGGR